MNVFLWCLLFFIVAVLTINCAIARSKEEGELTDVGLVMNQAQNEEGIQWHQH